MMALRTNVGMLPGGIRYQDPRTPAAEWTDAATSLEARTAQVINFRSANPNIYPEPEWTNPAFVSQQITDYNCQRVGFDPNWCINTTMPSWTPPAAPASRVCDCGATLTPNYCRTCGGQKVNGYTCPTCGKSYPP